MIGDHDLAHAGGDLGARPVRALDTRPSCPAAARRPDLRSLLASILSFACASLNVAIERIAYRRLAQRRRACAACDYRRSGRVRSSVSSRVCGKGGLQVTFRDLVPPRGDIPGEISFTSNHAGSLFKLKDLIVNHYSAIPVMIGL